MNNWWNNFCCCISLGSGPTTIVWATDLMSMSSLCVRLHFQTQDEFFIKLEWIWKFIIFLERAEKSELHSCPSKGPTLEYWNNATWSAVWKCRTLCCMNCTQHNSILHRKISSRKSLWAPLRFHQIRSSIHLGRCLLFHEFSGGKSIWNNRSLGRFCDFSDGGVVEFDYTNFVDGLPQQSDALFVCLKVSKSITLSCNANSERSWLLWIEFRIFRWIWMHLKAR